MDAHNLKSIACKSAKVQISPSAPIKNNISQR
jgi:hypothetical protein